MGIKPCAIYSDADKNSLHVKYCDESINIGGSMPTAPMSGKVKDVFAEVKSKVKEGQIIAIIEAMKMEIQIKSPLDEQ